MQDQGQTQASCQEARGAPAVQPNPLDRPCTPAPRPPSEQAACASTAYAKSGQPLYFALSIGLAAGENPHAAAGGVLAHNNPNTSVLGNGKGIDHLEASGIFPALENAAEACGIPIEEE